VQPGEVIGIIGPNGAGKSTLLKILSRITEPTEGRAKIRGRVGSLLEVGTGFHPELTGRDNIYLNGAILGMKRTEIKRKFDEIVAFAEVAKFIDTPVKRYSSGMYMRLAFAVAAHLEPEILLVDEVLAVGDTAFQKKCLGKMDEVSRRGHTVLFVSHNMVAVSSLCQRGILLSKGRIELNDSVDKTVARYLSTMREHQVPTLGRISLVDHPGRRDKHEGLIRLTHCCLLDSNQQFATFFRSGREARVLIGYEITHPIEGAQLIFVVGFNDIMQRRMFSCSSEIVGCEFKNTSAAGEVECVIPKLPLISGIYTINIGCKVGPAWSDGVYSAAEVEVVSGDFYGTGRLPPDTWGAFLVDHYWVDRPDQQQLGGPWNPASRSSAG
jgi:lipopolysaccharide transport system ATP-binding protein